jgi:hypothetical protein
MNERENELIIIIRKERGLERMKERESQKERKKDNLFQAQQLTVYLYRLVKNR